MTRRKKMKPGSKKNIQEVTFMNCDCKQKCLRGYGCKVLNQLLGNVDYKTFLNTYFEKKPLVVRKESMKGNVGKESFTKEKLLSLAQSLSLQLSKHLNICRYVDGVREDYTPTEEESKNVITREKLTELFNQGYSVQFFQPQRYVSEISRINEALEKCFGCLAGASVYQTPPGTQALAPHYDDVEVFIIQMEGKKHWKLYESPFELPGEASTDLSVNDIGTPFQELTLNAGDMLYFPRGTVHHALADSLTFSSHATFSIYQHHSWANFLEVSLPLVLRKAFDSDILYRKGLPPSYLSYMGSQHKSSNNEDMKEMKNEFVLKYKNLVAQLLTHIDMNDLDEAADEASMDFFANRLPSFKPPISEENSSITPLDKNVFFRLVDPSAIRLVIEKSENNEEALVSIYHSMKNLPENHMGSGQYPSMVSSDMEEFLEEEEEEDEDEDGNTEDENEMDIEMNEELGMNIGTPAPRCLSFPITLAPILSSMYAEFPSYTNLSTLEKTFSIKRDLLESVLMQLDTEDLLHLKVV